MAKEILKCTICNSYTMQITHCNQKTVTIKPAKYSPEDKYGSYRRKYLKERIKKRGSIDIPNELEN